MKNIFGTQQLSENMVIKFYISKVKGKTKYQLYTSEQDNVEHQIQGHYTDGNFIIDGKVEDRLQIQIYTDFRDGTFKYGNLCFENPCDDLLLYKAMEKI